MKRTAGGTQRLIGVACLAMLGLTGQSSAGDQSATGGAEPAAHDREAALASVSANREGVIDAIVERWRPTMDGLAYAKGWDVEIAGFLRAASAEKLLAASQAASYREVVAALHTRWTGPDVTPLAPGQSPVPQFGESNDELVFYPVTPCRIIDTRFATPATPIGPSSGRQFRTNLANYSAQGGFAGSCGIPLGFDPAAVAINVTSAAQAGAGFLAVVPTGAGIPNVSLVNYVAGPPIANAAVVRQAQGLSDDIFIYAGGAASHVVVDIMGYFAAPSATPVDNNTLVTSTNVAAGATFSIFSPPCPTSWRLTGGGVVCNSFAGPAAMGSRPVQGTSFAVVSGVNITDRWLCQGTNGGIAQEYHCFAVCSRTPGR
jgi:hypothetical protein